MNIPPLISRTPPPLPDDDDDDDDDDEFGHYVISDIIENGAADTYDDVIVGGIPECGELNNHPVNLKTIEEGISTLGPDFQQHPEPTDIRPTSSVTKDENDPAVCEVDEMVSSRISNCDSRNSEPISSEISELKELSTTHRECLSWNGATDCEQQPVPSIPGETSCDTSSNGGVLSKDLSHQDEFNSLEEHVTIPDVEFAFASSDCTQNGESSPDSSICNSDHAGHETTYGSTEHGPVKEDVFKTSTVDILPVQSSTSFNLSKNGDNSGPALSTEIEDDNSFDDFTDFQTSAPDDWPNTNIPSMDDGFGNQDHFAPEPSPHTPPIEEFDPRGLEEINNNAIWSCLQYLDETPALKYQWLSSSSNHKFLSALKIDSRNIFCGPWTRSSKSLGHDVILPVRATPCDDRTYRPNTVSGNSSVAQDVLPNLSFTANTKNSVPDPLFDWEGSGLVNPLFYSAKDDPSFNCHIRGGVEENQISSEAKEVLKHLPNLSFITKTYIAFKSIPVSK